MAANRYLGTRKQGYTPKAAASEILVPLALLKSCADQIASLAEDNQDIFDSLYESLQCLKGSGEWVGKDLEAAMAATEANKARFRQVLAELQSLAEFLDSYTAELEGKDQELKKRILSV